MDIESLGAALIIWSLILGLLIFPAYRTTTAWMVDKTLTFPQFVLSVVAHAGVVLLTYIIGMPWMAFVYLIGLNIYWMTETMLDEYRKKRRLMAIVDEEIAGLERRIQDDPDNGAYHSALGQAYLERQRYEEAIMSFERAIALLPEEVARKERVLLKSATEARYAAMGVQLPRHPYQDTR
jgi:cytochrome c-type biogenesis protein CcmH/NrfG